MPRTQTEEFQANFSRGFITELAPLGYPEGSCRDMDNLVLEKNGSVRVRNGLIVPEHAPSFTNEGEVFTIHRWPNVGENSKDFLVVQIGSELRIYTSDIESEESSLITTINIGEASNLKSKATNKRLFMAAEGITPFYLWYLPGGTRELQNTVYEGLSTSTTPTVIKIDIPLKVRDFEGVEDGLEVDERPTTITPEHRYNLRNQGWPLKAQVATAPESLTSGDPIDKTRQHAGFYPSNADIIHAYKIETPIGSGTTNVALTVGAYYTRYLNRTGFGNTPAPKGHYVIDFLSPDLSRAEVSNINLPVDPSNRTGPTAVEFFSQRVWYSGFQGRGVADKVLFSPVLSKNYQPEFVDGELQDSIPGECYQRQDPTAETFNDLLATDGGAVTIPGLGTVHDIVAIGKSVVVISNNGAWEITGTLEGFSAESFSIHKLTDSGSIAERSVVLSESVIFYWSNGDIIAIDYSQEVPSVVSISENTIATFYSNIPIEDRSDAYGAYNRSEKKVYWTYGEGRVLIYDLTLQAFSKYTLVLSSVGEPSEFEDGGPGEVVVTVRQEHTQEFTATGGGTWEVPAGVTSCDVIVVGGGGGTYTTRDAFGQYRICGGGGGGGVVIKEGHEVTPGETINLSVGTGGFEGDGNSSSFDGIVAQGGGEGGEAGVPAPDGGEGASGGGGSVSWDSNDPRSSATVGDGGNGIDGQGHDGSEGFVDTSVEDYPDYPRMFGGGGGGALEPGGTVSDVRYGGDGITDIPEWAKALGYTGFGGGGSGYAYSKPAPEVNPAPGGAGGGGASGVGTEDPEDGAPNTGGGAGSGLSSQFQNGSGTGGSGVVLVRWIIDDSYVKKFDDLFSDTVTALKNIKVMEIFGNATEEQTELVGVEGEQVVANSEDVQITSEVDIDSKFSRTYYIGSHLGKTTDTDRIIICRLDDQDSGNYYDLVPKEIAELGIEDKNYYPVKAYLELGSRGLGDLTRNKNATYVTSFFESKEYDVVPVVEDPFFNQDDGINFDLADSYEELNKQGVTLQTRIDWSILNSSGRWSKAQSAYKRPKIDIVEELNTLPDTGVVEDATIIDYPSGFLKNIAQKGAISPTTEVVSSRLRARGIGKAINLYYENERGKGFHLLGYSYPVQVNENV